MRPSRTFTTLCAVAFCAFISYDLVRRPALALYAESLGATPLIVGVLVAISTLTGVCLKLPVGVLSDLVNRRMFMFGGLLAFALPPFVYPLVTDMLLLGGLRLFHGLATALFTPLALVMVARLYVSRRGEAMGWYTAAAQGGGLIGPLLGGVLVYAIGFTQTFVVAGLFGVVCLGLFWSIGREPIASPTPAIPMRELLARVRTSVGQVVRHRGIMATSATEASKMMANGTLMAFLPLYGLSVGLNAAQVGVLFGAQALTSIFAKPAMGRVSDRFGRLPLIVTGLCLCGGVLIGLPYAASMMALLALSGAFGFGEAVVTASSTALIADLSHETLLGAGMGMRGTIMDMGHASGPILAGALIGSMGYGFGFAVIGIVQFVVAAVFGAVMIGMKRPAVL